MGLQIKKQPFLFNKSCFLEVHRTRCQDLNKTIIHSDHGYQYTSKDYNSKCLDNKIIISMGKNYHCADNIIIESFHSLLKKGTIHNKNYKSHNEYINDVKKWNKWYSNQKEKYIINESL
ncbi:hypothetical protein [Spiroplasma endosymbiont of Polydrusus cervinus]|uniref:hypothetical protein n=1 Tax=Spiroplasma endosymbiont of Polydrusus cervinus TaxID=3066287 RepID=UPI0030CC7C84